MFRVFDFDVLAMDLNTLYGIQWRDENGNAHAVEDDQFFKYYMSNVSEIIFFSEYHASGKPQMVFTVIDGTDDNYSTFIDPIPLQDFRKVLRQFPGQEPIRIHYDVDCDNENVFLAGFKIVPSDDKSSPPVVMVKTAETIVQPL